MRVIVAVALVLRAATATKSTDVDENTVQDLIGGIVETAQEINNLDEETSFEEAAKKQPLLLFKALPQRACPWSQFNKGTDWKFASMKSDDKEECARACVAAKGCTGFEVGPRTSKSYNYISYCALWFNKKCNDEPKMLRLNPQGYVATTFVMVKSVTVELKEEVDTPFGTIDVEEQKTFQPDESKEHYKPIDERSTETSTTQTEHLSEQVAQKQALQLFKALPQRACPWSSFKKGTDWKFASMKSDDKEACARACVAAEGCTGFEVGPHTSNAFDFISYCALWFNKNCYDETKMLRLNPQGYIATTFVMIKSATVEVVEEEKAGGKEENKEEEKTMLLQGNAISETTFPASSVSHFEEFPQLACNFAEYKEGSDWKYTDANSGDAESCATACTSTRGCTGFEIGIEPVRGQYCALWNSGACATKQSMTVIPADTQTVSTFVLADYHSHKIVLFDGFSILFLVACACALLISVLLVGCICFRVLHRACSRNAESNCRAGESVVAGELVQATVIRGTPVGQRVDVVIVRGEAVDQK